MRIGITSEWIGQRVGGPERYARELIERVVRLDRENHYRLFVTPSGGRSLARLESGRVRLRPSRWDSRWYFIPFGLPWSAFVCPVDLLHATFSFPPWCPVRRIVLTVHDVSPDVHPDFFRGGVARRVRWLLERGLARACRVLVPTEATKRELMAHYRVDAGKVRVLPYGVDHIELGPASPLRASAALPDSFILYVGRFHARKNLERLLEAFHLSASRRGGVRLVLVGRDFRNRDRVLSKIRQLDLQDAVWCPGHVSETELDELYRRARLFVYPSLHEGFGFPPLEAMARGVPVMASNVSAMPEVLGDGALLVNPYDPSQMAESIDQLVTDEARRRELVLRGKERASRFTWTRTAQGTLEVYQEVLATAA